MCCYECLCTKVIKLLSSLLLCTYDWWVIWWDLCPFRNWAELMDWFQQVNDHVAVGKYYYSVLSPCGWQELEKKKKRKMLHLRTAFRLNSYHKLVRDFNTGWCAGKTNICLAKLWKKSSEFNILLVWFFFFFGGGREGKIWWYSTGHTALLCQRDICPNSAKLVPDPAPVAFLRKSSVQRGQVLSNNHLYHSELILFSAFYVKF